MSKVEKSKSKVKGLSFGIALALIVVLFFAGLIYYSDHKKSEELGNLIDYSDYKGEIKVDGLDYDNQPSIGKDSAEVEIVEFADFKCPVCKRWNEEVFPKFKKDFIDTGKVKFHFENFAFIGRDSLLAASAGESIYAQNKESFWKFSELVYANQGDESELWANKSFLINLVKSNFPEINIDKFEEDLDKGTYFGNVKKDYETAKKFGVKGTPQFIVNGKLISGGSYEVLSQEVESALKASKGIGDE